MANKTGLKVLGAREVQGMLTEFPKRFQSRAVRVVMRDAMKTVILPEVQKTSRRESYDTGLMTKSFKVRAAKGPRNNRLPRGHIGFQIESAKTKRIDAYYTKWVLMDRKLRDGTTRRGTRLLRRMLYNNAVRWQNYVVDKLRAEIRKVPEELRSIASFRKS